VATKTPPVAARNDEIDDDDDKNDGDGDGLTAVTALESSWTHSVVALPLW